MHCLFGCLFLNFVLVDLGVHLAFGLKNLGYNIYCFSHKIVSLNCFRVQLYPFHHNHFSSDHQNRSEIYFYCISHDLAVIIDMTINCYYLYNSQLDHCKIIVGMITCFCYYRCSLNFRNLKNLFFLIILYFFKK